MRNISILAIAATLLYGCCGNQKDELGKLIDDAFSNAAKQYEALADSLMASQTVAIPHSLQDDGNLKLVDPSFWTSGFFPGTLWYIYEYNGDGKFRELAEKFTAMLESQQYNRKTHDIGFMMYCSYGNGMRMAPDSLKRSVLVNSAESLVSRFNPTVGCIRSWDKEVKPGWLYPVIIDNMMNLELLLWASEETGNPEYAEIAEAHANTTMSNHFREDNSSFHGVNYDAETGDVLMKGTFQGLADDSAWSRGQGWGLYGYTVLYRFTKDTRYLEQANKIAGYILSRKAMPEDSVPYWDFMVEDENSPRDASAAAIYASALLELSGYVEEKDCRRYRDFAIEILRTLSKPEYTATEGTNGRFLLKHSTTSFPKGIEVDKPLNYADYYYLEALLRLRTILEEQ